MGRGVLEGAFSLLEEIVDTEECGLSELAARTGLPKATVYRLLDQLVQLGAIEREDGRYRMGAKMFHFGRMWRPEANLRSAALHPLRQLATAIPGASVHVMVPQHNGCTLVVGALRGEAHEVLPIHTGTLYPAGNEWRRALTAVQQDGLFCAAESMCSPEVSIVSAPVHTQSGTLLGAVAAAVLDQRRMPAMIPAVRHAARLVSANVSRLRRTAGRT